MNKEKSGFTFMELLLVIVGITILFSVAFSTFWAASKAIQEHQERGPAGDELSQGLQKFSREIREAAKGTMGRYSGINHTLRYQDAEDGAYYILYLYSPDDLDLDNAYVSDTLYELRLAPETGFVYGAGRILSRYLFSPNAPEPADRAEILHFGGGNQYIQMTLTATEVPQAVSEKSERIRMRLKVRPRNES